MVIVTLSLAKLGAIAVKSVMAHSSTAAVGQAAAGSAGHPLFGVAATKAAGYAGGKAAAALLTGTAHSTGGGLALAHQAIAGHVALSAVQVHNGVVLGAAGGAVVTAGVLGSAMERAFVTGFAARAFDIEVTDRLDRRALKLWFTTTGRTPKAGLGFTATGHIRDGRFLPEPIASVGPVRILQGVLSEDRSRVVRGRVVEVRAEVSRSLRRDHSGSGVAVYGTVRG